MPNNPQQVRNAHMLTSASKSLCSTDMTQLILKHPTWTDSQIALHIVQMLFIFFAVICQRVCGGAVCGRSSLQRNIWNGSKVYEVAAVNPVDVPQHFFHSKGVATASGRPLTEPIFFVACGYEGIVLALSLLGRYCQVLSVFMCTAV